MDRKNKRPSGCGILLIVLFFPYSLIYLAVQALLDPKADLKKKGMTLIWMGVFSVICGIVGIVSVLTGHITGDPSGFPIVVVICVTVFGGGGVALMVRGWTQCRKHRIYERYVNVVLNSGESSLSGIAAILGTDRQTAMKDLEKIVGVGALKGAYIDHMNDRVMLPPQRELPQDAVFCPSCGAQQQVPAGQARFCEYCGSPIRR